MSTANKFLHYLGIALAVFVGVFAARFLYAYMVTTVVVTELEAIGEQFQEDARAMQEKNARDAQRRRKTAEQQRKQSKTGRDLYRRCAEYAEFHRNHPGQYAFEQERKACTSYRTYVQTGKRAS